MAHLARIQNKLEVALIHYKIALALLEQQVNVFHLKQIKNFKTSEEVYKDLVLQFPEYKIINITQSVLENNEVLNKFKNETISKTKTILFHCNENNLCEVIYTKHSLTFYIKMYSSYLIKSKIFKEFNEDERQLMNIYNGISGVFRSIKQWPEALHYLYKAEKIDPFDPDIQMTFGVAFTEMRRTDLAEIAYNKGIENYSRTIVSTDPKFLLSELYLNLGHMHSYNGENNKSLDCYNKALQICPKFTLPFQNKLMNLCYIFDQLDDPMYIYKQHLLVNKLFKKDVLFKQNKASSKINIGIISGDFIDHPVGFFISTFLKGYNKSKFNVICYSECIIHTQQFTFKLIKGMSAEKVADIISNDSIHILLDLSGHTGQNRLDVFALKPAPIQVTYIGYPYSTGLKEMDYRITDSFCDNKLISQPFYTEKLLFMENCFLCYDHNGLESKETSHSIDSQPFLKNKFITIGCFNRLNKITDNVIKVYNNILLTFPNVKFFFKTKALLNNTIQQKFLNKFDKSVHSRIIIKDCTISHNDHLLEYNNVDISLDTWPYSGTTTSCESLYMGCPVLSLYDQKFYYHPMNVSCSILKNSDLDFYVCNNTQEIIDKIKILQEKPIDFWQNLKEDTRNKFLNGKVCNKELYLDNIQELFTGLYNKNKQ